MASDERTIGTLLCKDTLRNNSPTKRDDLKSIVSRFSRGSVLLQQGAYVTADDLEEERKELADFFGIER